MTRVPDAELPARTLWLDLLARHYPRARGLWLVADLEGEMVGCLPLVQRRRRGLSRLESSLDGVVCGPQVPADLPAVLQSAVYLALVRDLGRRVRGRCLLAALTLSSGAETRFVQEAPGPLWNTVETRAAVVPCLGGLEAAENRLDRVRRRERDRSLSLGCTIREEQDPARLIPWYPLYLERAARFAQEPVPLAFMQDLMRQAPDQVLFGTVSRGGRLLGGHFGFVSNGRLVSWQGGVRRDREPGVFPNVLLYWLDIMIACERGLEAVDFGACDGRDSLWDFKRRFGAVPERRRQFQRWSRVGVVLRRTAKVYRSVVGVSR